MSIVGSAVAMGIIASAFMDLWNSLLRWGFSIPSLNYCLLGRWLLHMPDGIFRHENITRAVQKPLECLVGWCSHYGIGVVLALAFVLLAGGEWLAQPTFLPALLFGIVTVAFPLLVMQPALGLGLASAKTPRPLQARLKSLGTHSVFGVGLYLGALGVNQIL